MSVTFRPSFEDGRPLLRCACPENLDSLRNLCPACLATLNVNNRNAGDLLRWLDLPANELIGSITASELAARCKRRLWNEERNFDPAISAEETNAALVRAGARVAATTGARIVVMGRGAGYLRERTETLLRIATMAGDFYVSWG